MLAFKYGDFQGRGAGAAIVTAMGQPHYRLIVETGGSSYLMGSNSQLAAEYEDTVLHFLAEYVRAAIEVDLLTQLQAGIVHATLSTYDLIPVEPEVEQALRDNAQRIVDKAVAARDRSNGYASSKSPPRRWI